jgi:IS5 family transposase
MHPLEEEMQAARAYQQRPEGRTHLRERVVAEHRLARLGQLGMGQARYMGHSKTRCQLLLLSTIANLQRTWNWVQGQGGKGEATGGERLAYAA